MGIWARFSQLRWFSFNGLFCIAIITVLVNSAGVAAPLATVIAKTSVIAQTHSVDGIVEAIQQSTVSAETKGRVVEVKFDVDDIVKKDSVLVRITSIEQQSKVSEARANQREAKTRFDAADTEYQRVKDLLAKKLIAKSKFDQASADLKAARQRTKATKAALLRALKQLDYTSIRAPYGGVVAKRHVELGETVVPGQAVMTGLSLNHLRVVAAIPQSYVNNIRSASSVNISFPDAKSPSIDTQHITVSPLADTKSHSFNVRARLPENLKNVYPGMFTKLHFAIGEAKILMLPVQTVVKRSELTAVYVINKEGNVRFRHVRTGMRLANDAVEILSGIEEGEQVALDPISAGIELKQQLEANLDVRSIHE